MMTDQYLNNWRERHQLALILRIWSRAIRPLSSARPGRVDPRHGNFSS